MHNVKLEEIQNTWAADNSDRFFVGMQDSKFKRDEFVTSSPQGSDSGLGSDSPEGNLTWLLNFKLDEIPGLPGNSLYLFLHRKIFNQLILSVKH